LAHFRVKETFARAERNQFILAGEVSHGVVTAGMKLLVPFNSSLSLSAIIDRVEPVTPTKIAEQGHIALCIGVDDSDELLLWKGLDIKDEVLEVVPAQDKSR